MSLNILHEFFQNESLVIPFGSSSKEKNEMDIIKLRSRKNITIDEIAQFQSQMNFEGCTNRKVIIASSWDDFQNERNEIDSESIMNVESNSKKKVIMITNTQPSISVRMGSQLYTKYPVYKRVVDMIDSLFAQHSGYSFLAKFTTLPIDEITFDYSIILPKLFSHQVAIYHLYKYFGIEPSIVIGFGEGEIAAFYISGSISLEDAVKIMYHRTLLLDRSHLDLLSKGRILTIKMDYQQYMDTFYSRYPMFTCSKKTNGMAAVTGHRDHFNDLINELRSKNIPFCFSSEGALISKAQKSVLQTFKDLKAKVPNIPWYSSITKSLKATPVDAQYIYDNIKKPQEIFATLETLKKDIGHKKDDYVFLELFNQLYLDQCIPSIIPDPIVISANKRFEDEIQSFLNTLGLLFCNGLNVKFTPQFTTPLPNSKL